MNKLTLFLLLFCMVLFAQAQKTIQKQVKIVFYDAQNKPATLDKVNADLEKHVLTHLLTKRQYGNDSVIYRVEKPPGI